MNWRSISLAAGVVAALSVAQLAPGQAIERVRLFAAEFADVPGKLELTIYLTRIVFPFLTLVAIAAVLMGMLNSLGHFFIPALSPAMFNLVTIVFAFAVVPFGGGTSVVGGVEPAVGDGFAGVASLDLEALAGVVEVDRVARAARVLAGTTGPALEAGLRPHGLTLRFYPQSFERSTVGGWLATRAAGHFSTRATHVDDLVESIRMVTPAGVWASRRLPGSGAGPSPDRLALGSEGVLGVVTEAWLRVRPRPARRAAATVAFGTFEAGAAAVRGLLHAGVEPATCRLVDAAEAALTGTLAGGEAALVLGFESAHLPLEAELDAALELCRTGGGRALDARAGADAGASWRASFRRAPHLRERLVLLGVMVETFETAVTWERLDGLVAAVREATRAALASACGGGVVTCRLTHAYPDGAAPYFTVLAPARRGGELGQWAEVKAAAAEAVLAAGGTITHHHAVGRDHRPWYDRQRPEPFAAALRAAKAAVDPAGVLNPGVLLDPLGVTLMSPS